MNRKSLASTFVGSPDPRQARPPKGEKLILEWNIPRDSIEKEPFILFLQVLYRNYDKEKICYPITKRRGVYTFPLMGEKYEQTGGFLTYRAEISTLEGPPIKTWKQQLWVDLITLDEEWKE